MGPAFSAQRGGRTLVPSTPSMAVFGPSEEDALDATLGSVAPPVLIFIVSDGCGHCKALQPTLRTLGARMRPKHNQCRIIVADHSSAAASTSPVLSSRPITGVPTILGLTESGDVVEHEGERDADALETFLSSLGEAEAAEADIDEDEAEVSPPSRTDGNVIIGKPVTVSKRSGALSPAPSILLGGRRRRRRRTRGHRRTGRRSMARRSMARRSMARRRTRGHKRMASRRTRGRKRMARRRTRDRRHRR